MVIVVGGHSRNIGKTSVVAGIIQALPEADWTAVKISQYGHGVCATDGESCGCAPTSAIHPYALDEEAPPATKTDSGRFLRAGARRSFWLRTAQGELGAAMAALREILKSSGNVIIESNSVIQFLKPTLFIVVLDFSVVDMKPSTRKFLDRADAFVLVDRGTGKMPWEGISERWFKGKPQFWVRPPNYADEPLVGLVRSAFAQPVASGEL